MYFEDLSKVEFYLVVKIKIGWLDISQPYTKGFVPKDFIEKLKSIEPTLYAKGWHDCPFCNNAASSSQFIIHKSENEYYDAPYMIIHYIEEHCYLPPQEFIDAIMKL